MAFVRWRSTVGVRRLLTLSGVAFAVQRLMLVAVVEPIQDVEYDTRGFVTQVEAMRAQQPGPLVFFGIGQDSWAIRYMMNLDHDEKPIFVACEQKAQLDALPAGAWVVLARQAASCWQAHDWRSSNQYWSAA